MKVSIERSALLKAMSQAQSVVERRNTIPILANVLIEAEGGEISFRATDLDIEVVYKVVGMVERAGATTVGAHTLHEIVRKLPDGAMVELTDDATANRLDVVAGRSSFSLATLPREDFPIMANSEYACNFSAQAETLRRLFDKSKFAISTEETRYYLNGVYMHSSDGENGRVLRCVATDGHRLARIDTQLPEGAETLPGVIVPRKTVGELRKLLDDDEMLKLFRAGELPESIKLKEGMGYEFEIRTFIDEILSGNKTNFELLKQAAETIKIIEAEKKSIDTCKVVSI